MMWFFFLGLAGLVIAGVWWFSQGNYRGMNRPASDPLEILNSRYASGELTRDEYEDMKRDIMEG